MELVLPTIAAIPWLGGLAGIAFVATVLAALVGLAYFAGLYYAIPRSIMKFLEQAAIRRIA